MMKISGCIALVTGGASGIGRGICELLLQLGAKVNVIVFSFILKRALYSYLKASNVNNQNLHGHPGNIPDSPGGLRPNFV